MSNLIDKDTLVAEIKKIKDEIGIGLNAYEMGEENGKAEMCELFLSFIDTLEAKDMDLIIHTIIAECCNWLAVHTELNHEQIEDCRNLMLTVKDEQLKAKQD